MTAASTTAAPQGSVPVRRRWLASQIALSIATSWLAASTLTMLPVSGRFPPVVLGALAAIIPWWRGWSQRRRGLAALGGAILVLGGASQAAIVAVLAYLMALVSAALTVRGGGRLTPLLPALAALLVVLWLEPGVSSAWIAIALPFGWCALLFGLLRELASSREVVIDETATRHGAVLRRRRRWVAVPLLTAVALTGGIAGAAQTLVDGSQRAEQQRSIDDIAGPGRRYDPESGPRLRPTMTTRAPVPPALRRQVDHIRRSTQPAVMFALLSAQVRVRDPNGRSGMTTGGRFRPVRVWRRGYGTAEERAALLVMIARGAGFRCRVVRLGTSEHAVPSGTPHVWPEVHFEDAGWIAFPADIAVAPPTRADVRGWAELGARGRVIEVAHAIRRSAWWALLVAAGRIAAIGALAVAAAGVVAGLVGRPVRRSLRRRRSRQDERIAGAWREVTDLLRLRGAASTAASSVAEVVAVARALDGDAAARGVAALGQVAERAWFGRSAPGPADAERAWDWEREVRAELIAAAPAWRRPLLAVDPRPVVWDLADAWSRVTARRRPFARPAGRTRRGRHRVRVAPS